VLKLGCRPGRHLEHHHRHQGIAALDGSGDDRVKRPRLSARALRSELERERASLGDDAFRRRNQVSPGARLLGPVRNGLQRSPGSARREHQTAAYLLDSCALEPEPGPVVRFRAFSSAQTGPQNLLALGIRVSEQPNIAKPCV
jgi:hypothetical protein